MKNETILKLMSGLFAVLVLALVFQLPAVLEAEESAPENDDVELIEMRSVESQWDFDPGQIEVAAGTTVQIELYNEDDFTHGFAIDELGIDEELPGEEMTTITFTADQPGEFTYYCSLPCGEGHDEHEGTLIVRGNE